MTVTVKLDATMEERLRARAASTGRTTSELIRAALLSFLAEDETPVRSAFELGHDLFGRHRGAADLAANRKEALADAWLARQRAR